MLGKYLLTALAMEGKFSGEGLNSMGDEDMMTSLARELVEQGHVGESASKIWSDLRAQRELTMPTAASEPESVVSMMDLPAVDALTEQMFPVSVTEPENAVPVAVVVNVVEDLPVLWSTYRIGMLPVLTSGVRSETRFEPYPVRTRRRNLTHTQLGQLSLFEIPSVCNGSSPNLAWAAISS